MGADLRSCSFPQCVRIKKSDDFLKVIKARGKSAIRLSGRWFELKAVPYSKEKVIVGLTVGKRFAKRSVDRNLVKRILREAVRTSSLCNLSLSRNQPVSARVVFRLIRPLPESNFGNFSQRKFKQEIQVEAAALIRSLLERLETPSEKKE